MTLSRINITTDAQLRLAGSNGASTAHRPIDRRLTIGRESADILLPIPAVSRQHACVKPTNAGYEIHNLGSQNGTAVNGDLLDNMPRLLLHGDTILLARHVELQFADLNATPTIAARGSVNGL